MIWIAAAAVCLIVQGFQLEFTPLKNNFRPPINPEQDIFSASHCFSGSLQQDSWRTNTCFYKNLCFDTKTKEFLYYTKDVSDIPQEVSIGTFNYKWGSQYDAVVKFRPKIVKGPIPRDRLETTEGSLWIPHLPFCPSNIGHLIWDDYLTWFLLSYTVKSLLKTPSNFHIRPLWFNPPNNPPWATCDWIRLHEGPGHSLQAGTSNTCLKNNKRWLPLILGEGNEELIETNQFSPSSENNLICFRESATGLTSFSNQGSGHHGWNPTDHIPPSFGRGPLIWDFRNHMMSAVKAKDVPEKSLKEVIIFFSSKSSNRINIDFTNHANSLSKQLEKIQKRVNSIAGHSRLKVVIKHDVLYKLSAFEQIDLTSKVCLFVTAAGGGAFTAQFLPKGSSIIFFHHSSGEHMHQGRVDWKFFNGNGWMRPTFLDYVTQWEDETLFQKLVLEEVLNCVLFMPALDA